MGGEACKLEGAYIQCDTETFSKLEFVAFQCFSGVGFLTKGSGQAFEDLVAPSKDNAEDSPGDKQTFSLWERSSREGRVQRRADKIIKQLDVA